MTLHISTAMRGLSAHLSCGGQVLQSGCILLEIIKHIRTKLVLMRWSTTRIINHRPIHKQIRMPKTMSVKRDASLLVSPHN